ncbi:unnamed protein product, partial [marine sediment metagenome]
AVPPMSSMHHRHAQAGHRTGAGSPQGITLQFVLTAMRQWWKVATPVGLTLAVTAVALIWWLTPRQYEAHALLQIREKKPYLAFAERDNWDRFVKTQLDLIRRPSLLAEVVSRDRHPEVAGIPELNEQTLVERWLKWEPDPIQRLQKKLQVTPVGGSDLLQISFTCRDSVHSMAVVNAVAQEYQKLLKGQGDEQDVDLIERLEKERGLRTRPGGKVATAREKVRKLTEKAMGKNPFAAAPDPGLPVESPSVRLQDSLINAEASREVLKVEIKALEESFVWLGSAG